MRYLFFHSTVVAILLANKLVHTTAQLPAVGEVAAFIEEPKRPTLLRISRRKGKPFSRSKLFLKLRGGASLHSNLAASWLDSQQAALSNTRQNVRATAKAWPKTVNGLTAAAFFIWGDLVAQVRGSIVKH
jgi:hypothetical protein